MESWVIPCNPNWFDVFGAFRDLGTIDWGQVATSIQAGDTVYIYTGDPVKAITHKCLVLDTHIPYEEVDHSDDAYNLVTDNSHSSQYMRLQMIKEYDPQVLSWSKLVECGLKGNIRSQRRTGSFIQAAIDSLDN